MSALAGFRDLLVPVDFSGEDEPLLELVLGLENRPRVTLLHVIEALERETDEELDEFYSMLQSNAQRRIAELASRFRGAGFEVREEVRVGRRAGEIVRLSVAVECDLIVMRSRKVDPAQPQDALRALGHQVSVLCPCPVLLLK